ncbi:MAG TPA: response regulator transcription factor [Candidatus Baltobacteraceae bacterium]|nr:response regulator transcription factor [Candidatus Baltobacteraceae bacterium]
MGAQLKTVGARPIRLLVIDDHPVVRDGVALLAASTRRIELVGYAPNGKSAVELAASAAPDVILLDLRLPDMLAPELIGMLRRSVPEARIVIFTAYPNHPAVCAALSAGACGIVAKDAARTDLAAVITGAMDGEEGGAPTTVPARAHTMVGRREYDVLRRVAIGETNHEIAEAMSLSPNTVKAYLRNLMQKLDARNRVEAISRAREAGLL